MKIKLLDTYLNTWVSTGTMNLILLVQVLFLVATQINSCSQYMWTTDLDENPIQVLEFSLVPNSDFPFLRTFRELTQHAS